MYKSFRVCDGNNKLRSNNSIIQRNPILCAHSYLLLLNWTDNMKSKSWIGKAVTRAKKGKLFNVSYVV